MTAPTVDTAPEVTSVNLVSNREWIASMPLEVRIALASIEATGMAVNEFESGSIFYEVEVEFLGLPSSLGAVMAEVTDAIRAHSERWGVEARDISTVLTHIRTDSLRHSYNEGLARLLRWVGEDTSRYDED